MKRFKEFIKTPKQPKEEFIFNSHGSHAKLSPVKPKEEFIFNSHGSHAKITPEKLKENHTSVDADDDVLPDLQKYTSKSENDHLGPLGAFGDHKDKMDTLQKDHPHSKEGTTALEVYTRGSEHVTNALLGRTNVKDEEYKHRAVDLHNKIVEHGHTPLKHDHLKTYSGVGFDIDNVKPVGKDKLGNFVYHQPTHLSSSIEKSTARSFARTSSNDNLLPDRHILHFHNEKGQPVGVIGKNSEFPSEHEVLIPSTDSHPNRYHLSHIGTESYRDPRDENRIYHIHHVKRVPESEIVKD
jgi:hypothetical protein